MKTILKMYLPIAIVFMAFSDFYVSSKPKDFDNDSLNVNMLYTEQYDPIKDEGQYWLPKQKKGTNYWVVVNASSNENTFNDNSLRNHILAESIVGLTSLAVNEGTGNTMVWTEVNNSNYTEAEKQLGMKFNGKQTTWELLAYQDNVKKQIDGYVLCKVRNEESINVATIASHVYRSIIVDEFYEDSIKALGYEMKYDASNITTEEAWNEFREECNNDALVLMPTQTGNLKSFVIANRLMSLNYNKKMGSTSAGNNQKVFEEVLDWLDPVSPVLGWEQGLGEDAFVEPVSKSGNLMIPSDWLYNPTLLSAAYESNQPGLASVTNPNFIEYTDSLHYASFFLSDGDNVQWMMNNFLSADYYSSVLNSKLKMGFGLPVANLAMIAPEQLDRIFNEQAPDNTLMEFGGGGYYYPDNFAKNKNRGAILEEVAMKIGVHMRQHRVKILGLLCMDVDSPEAQEAYASYIRNNDQLQGIVAIQYYPYAGGEGKVMWFENSEGIEIPVVTARYAIWNHGNSNLPNQGTPTYIASKINELSQQSETSHSLVVVHAWSKFTYIGDSDDPLRENLGGNTAGANPVSWCQNKLNSNVKVVNIEELIWQIRMNKNPEQTKEYLSRYL